MKDFIKINENDNVIVAIKELEERERGRRIRKAPARAG